MTIYEKLDNINVKTKSDISECFALLRKCGYMVINNQDKRKLRKGQTNMTDLFVAGHGRLLFCEIKTVSTKDKLSSGQSELGKEIQKAEIDFPNGWNVKYKIVDEYNCKEVVQMMIWISGIE